MNVGIDQSRKDGGLAEVMDLVSIQYLIRGNDCLNPLFVDKDSCWTDSVRSDHSSSDKGVQAQNVGSLDDLKKTGGAYPNHDQASRMLTWLEQDLRKFRA